MPPHCFTIECNLSKSRSASRETVRLHFYRAARGNPAPAGSSGIRRSGACVDAHEGDDTTRRHEAGASIGEALEFVLFSDTGVEPRSGKRNALLRSSPLRTGRASHPGTQLKPFGHLPFPREAQHAENVRTRRALAPATPRPQPCVVSGAHVALRGAGDVAAAACRTTGGEWRATCVSGRSASGSSCRSPLDVKGCTDCNTSAHVCYDRALWASHG